jgi:hypothetical protein
LEHLPRSGRDRQCAQSRETAPERRLPARSLLHPSAGQDPGPAPSSSLLGVPRCARELAPRRVNAVSPGFVATPWYHHIPESERIEAERFAASQSPVGRIGAPDDVAHALLYVVANGFVTGSVIECDGGVRVANDTLDTGLPK